MDFENSDKEIMKELEDIISCLNNCKEIPKTKIYDLELKFEVKYYIKDNSYCKEEYDNLIDLIKGLTMILGFSNYVRNRTNIIIRPFTKKKMDTYNSIEYSETMKDDYY